MNLYIQGFNLSLQQQQLMDGCMDGWMMGGWGLKLESVHPELVPSPPSTFTPEPVAEGQQTSTSTSSHGPGGAVAARGGASLTGAE